MSTVRPAAPPAWFGDLFEIDTLIETLDDASDALPWLRRLLVAALAGRRAERDVRPLNTFEEPVSHALQLVDALEHAGELDAARLQQLQQHLRNAHAARLDAESTARAMARPRAMRSSAATRTARTAKLRSEVREAAVALLAQGKRPRELAGILAPRFKLSPRRIRSLLRAEKRK